MISQEIILGTTSAAGSLGLARPDRDIADIAALRIPSLSQVFRARDVAPNAQGALVGASPRTGGPIVSSGNFPAAWTKSDSNAAFNGQPTVSNNGSANVIKMPAGSATSSYTVVLACSFTNAGLNTAAGGPSTLVGIYNQDSDDPITRIAVLRSAALSGDTGFICNGADVNAPSAIIPIANLSGPDVAMILIADWDNAGKKIRVAINSSTPFAETTSAGESLVVNPDSYIGFGQGNFSYSWRGSFTRAYCYGTSLMSDPIGQLQLADLVNAMKVVNGIA